MFICCSKPKVKQQTNIQKQHSQTSKPLNIQYTSSQIKQLWTTKTCVEQTKFSIDSVQTHPELEILLKLLQSKRSDLKILKLKLKLIISEIQYQYDIPDLKELANENKEWSSSADLNQKTLIYLGALQKVYDKTDNPFSMLLRSEEFRLNYQDSFYTILEPLRDEISFILGNKLDSQTLKFLQDFVQIAEQINILVNYSDQILQPTQQLVEVVTQILNYYRKYLSELHQMLQKSIVDENNVKIYIQAEYIQEGDSFNNYAMRSPLIVANELSNTNAMKLINLDKQFLAEMGQKDLQITRIGTEQVFIYQRYLFSYLTKKYLFNLKALPGVVFRVRKESVKISKGQSKQTTKSKQYYYFFVSVKPSGNFTLLLDTTNTLECGVVSVHDNKSLKFNLESFAIHYVANHITQQYDFINTNYAIDNNTNELISYPDHRLSDKGEPRFNSFKNQLYYYKNILNDQQFNEMFLQTFFQGHKITSQFLAMLEYILPLTLNDFQYPNFKKNDKDYFRRKRSLALTKHSLFYLLKSLNNFKDTVTWIKQVILPQYSNFSLNQFSQKFSPVIYNFLKLNVQAKTNREILELYNSIDLQEILLRILNKKDFLKFNQNIIMVTEQKIDKRKRQFLSKNEKDNSGFISLPIAKIIELLQQIDVKYHLSRVQRFMTLKFLAVKVLPNITTFLKLFPDSFQRCFMDNFNDSWKSDEVWNDTFSLPQQKTNLFQYLTGKFTEPEQRKVQTAPILEYKFLDSLKEDQIFEQKDNSLVLKDILTDPDGQSIRNLYEELFEKHLIQANQLAFLKINEERGLLIWQQQRFLIHELAQYNLMKLLECEQYLPKKELHYLRGQYFGVREVIANKQSLSELLQKKSESEITQTLSKFHLSVRIILEILLLPSDSNPNFEYFFEDKLVNNQFLQDEDVNFINSKSFFLHNGKVKLGCKSIFFLMKYMNEPVDIKTRDFFLLKQKDVYTLIGIWVKQLKQIVKEAINIKKQSIGKSQVVPLKVQSFLGFTMEKEQLLALNIRASKIQSLLHKQDQKLTHLDILSHVDPLLARFYQNYLQIDNLNLLQKYRCLQSLNQKWSSVEIILGVDISTFLQGLNSNTLQNKVPYSQNLINLRSPRILYKTFVKYNYMKPENKTKDALNKLLYLRNDNHLYYYCQNLDVFSMDLVAQSEFVGAISQLQLDYKKLIGYINLQDFSFMHGDNLKYLQYNNVYYLNLRGVHLLTHKDIRIIADRCRSLLYLDVSGCPSIEEINGGKAFYEKVLANNLFISPVHFHSLKTFILEDNSKLVNVEISGLHLENISFKNVFEQLINFSQCSKLFTVFDIKVPKLKRINVEGCESLHLGILRLWIISGKEVKVDSLTTLGTFKDQLIIYENQILLEITNGDTGELIKSSRYNKYFDLVRILFAKMVLESQHSDALDISAIWLYKKGYLLQDFSSYMNSSTSGTSLNTLKQKSKDYILLGIIKSLFQNTKIKQLEFEEILNAFQDLQEPIVLQLINGVAQTTSNILGQEKNNFIVEEIVRLQTFFLGISKYIKQNKIDDKIPQSTLDQIQKIIKYIQKNKLSRPQSPDQKIHPAQTLLDNHQQKRKEIQKYEYKYDGHRFTSCVDYKRIGLSIDGGGTRGLIPATVINFISREIKKEPYEIFDSVGGTSIGGILSLSITGTSDGINPLADSDEIVKIFTEHSSAIFDRDSILGTVLNAIDKSKFDPAGLESVLMKYFSTCKLSDVLPGTNVIVTTVRMEKQQGKNMAKIFRSKDALKFLKKNFLMRDVGRATSAAPTYFPAAKISSLSGKQYALIDGGVGLNNPSKLVIDEISAQSLIDGNPENYYVLSLSTGATIKTSNVKADAGVLQVKEIIDAFGTSAQDYVDKELETNYAGKFLRIIPEIPVEDTKAQLDSSDPEVFRQYMETTTEYAENLLVKNQIFGQYKDRSFIEWIAENTDRKKENRFLI